MSSDTNRDVDLLLDEIREEAWATRQYTGRPAFDERVMAALREVPRHSFVPDELRHRAYGNYPLPIGCGQTISQPFIVALMTDLAQPRPNDAVLEIGTGSGYQAAILSLLVKRVYSVEIVEELAREAGARLQRMGYANVEVRAGNGRLGWPQHAPFDAILVAATASRIPPALIEQLKPGSPHSAQDLLVLKKNARGQVEERNVLPVAFVPLTGTAEA